MKIILLTLVSLIIGMLCSAFKISIDTFVITTLYNAICIVFSVGMGLIVTFSLNGVKNPSIVKKIRFNIRSIRQKFIILFTLCTIFLIFEKYWPNITAFCINLKNFLHIFTIAFFTLSILYFIYNFTKIQKLRDDMFDKILNEEEKLK